MSPSLVNGSLGRVIDILTVADAIKKYGYFVRGQQQQENGASAAALVETEDGKQTDAQRFPIVEFTNSDKVQIQPAKFEVVNGAGVMEVSRDQVGTLPDQS